MINEEENNEEVLGDLTPRTEEEKAIFTQAVHKLLSSIELKKKQIARGEFRDANGLFMTNKRLREGSDGFSKDRQFRKVADIPPSVVERLKMKYGNEIVDRKNTEKMVKVLKTDPEFEGCLTVKKNTI